MSRRKQLKPKSLRADRPQPFSSPLTIGRQGAADHHPLNSHSPDFDHEERLAVAKSIEDNGTPTLSIEDNLISREIVLPSSPNSALKGSGKFSDCQVENSEQRAQSTSSTSSSTTFSCELCDQTFKNVGTLQRHTLSYHSVQDIRSGLSVCSDPVYRCNYCPRKFDAILSLHKHVSNNHHEAEKVERTRLSINGDDNHFMCAHCDITLNSLAAFANHMREHVNKAEAAESSDAQCDLCSASFSNRAEMDRHVVEHFLNKTTQYSCHGCVDQSFDNGNQLRKHLTSDHSVCIYKCGLCLKIFDFKADLELHLLDTHAEEKTYWRCCTCHVVLESYDQFAVHVQLEHNRRSLPTRSMTQSSSSTFAHQDNAVNECRARSSKGSTSQMVNAFRCPTCDQSFTVEFLFERHLQIEHGDMMAGVSNNQPSWSLVPAPSINTVYVKCNVCDRKCASVHELAEHKLTHCKVVRAAHCGVCLEPIDTAELYYQHTRRHNHDGGPMNCVVCKQSLVDPIELDAHANFHLNHAHKAETNGINADHQKELREEKQYACIKCQQAFSTEHDIRAHVATHLLQEGYEHHCLLCHQIFNSPARLQCHLIEHSFAGCSELQCYLCGMVFSMSQPLQQHMFTHSIEDRPYDCASCNQRFFFRAELQNHQFSHPPALRTIDVKRDEDVEIVQATVSPSQPRQQSAGNSNCNSEEKSSADHSCPRCPKTFSSLSALQGHSHVHMNNRLHRCDTCGLGFTTPSKLITHKRRHSGEKPFMCRICDRKFSRKDNLKAHMRNHGASLESLQSRLCNSSDNADTARTNDSSSTSQHTSTQSDDDECSNDKPL